MIRLLVLLLTFCFGLSVNLDENVPVTFVEKASKRKISNYYDEKLVSVDLKTNLYGKKAGFTNFDCFRVPIVNNVNTLVIPSLFIALQLNNIQFDKDISEFELYDSFDALFGGKILSRYKLEDAVFGAYFKCGVILDVSTYIASNFMFGVGAEYANKTFFSYLDIGGPLSLSAHKDKGKVILASLERQPKTTKIETYETDKLEQIFHTASFTIGTELDKFEDFLSAATAALQFYGKFDLVNKGEQKLGANVIATLAMQDTGITLKVNFGFEHSRKFNMHFGLAVNFCPVTTSHNLDKTSLDKYMEAPSEIYNLPAVVRESNYTNNKVIDSKVVPGVSIGFKGNGTEQIVFDENYYEFLEARDLSPTSMEKISSLAHVDAKGKIQIINSQAQDDVDLTHAELTVLAQFSTKYFTDELKEYIKEKFKEFAEQNPEVFGHSRNPFFNFRL